MEAPAKPRFIRASHITDSRQVASVNISSNRGVVRASRARVAASMKLFRHAAATRCVGRKQVAKRREPTRRARRAKRREPGEMEKMSFRDEDGDNDRAIDRTIALRNQEHRANAVFIVGSKSRTTSRITTTTTIDKGSLGAGLLLVLTLFGGFLSGEPTLASKPNNSWQNGSIKGSSIETGRHITAILEKFQLEDGYDKRVRPNYGGRAVEVQVTMHILSISSVSEVMMDFTADFYFRQIWNDSRLSFDKLDSVHTLYVGAEVSRKIWLPDTFFGNEKMAYFHEATTPNVFLRIEHTGQIYRSIRLTVTSSCPMNLQYFPMDRQRCTIEVESYGYDVKDINYFWHDTLFPNGSVKSAVERDDHISLPQFDIEKILQKEKYQNLTTGDYKRLIAEIYFNRRMGYYLIQIYIPSSLIVVISWVSFWLHRNASPARVQLGVTTVLTMTTLMSSTNAALPKISYVKSIDIFLGTCFIMVFAALLEYATVGYLGKRIAMRKAQVQHAQSQAQARVFAQLQAQGAQGDPVPPTAASALFGEPSIGAQTTTPSTTLGTQQQQQAAELASQFTPPIPERNHSQCHCSHQSSSLLFQQQQSANNNQSHHRHLVNDQQQRCRLHACYCSNGSSVTNFEHQQQQLPLSSRISRKLSQKTSLDGGCRGAVSGSKCRSCGGHTTMLKNSHLAFAATDRSSCEEPIVAMSTAAAKIAADAVQNFAYQQQMAAGLPPSYSIKGGGPSAAATAAAATFVNMHRRNKGLPPSTNPNLTQYSWVTPQNQSLESIYGVRPSDIDKYSRVVFPVCFVCFQLMYWIVYLHISAFLDHGDLKHKTS